MYLLRRRLGERFRFRVIGRGAVATGDQLPDAKVLAKQRHVILRVIER